MKFLDYYRVLGVTKTTSSGDIKKAYRKLARRYHPDVNPSDQAAEKHFKEVNEAHEVLGDPEKRRRYDALGANWQHYDQIRGAGSHSSGVRSQPFGFPGGGTSVNWNIQGEGRSGNIGNMFGGVPFSDFFQTFSSGASPRNKHGRGRVNNPTKAHVLDLSLEHAFSGCLRRLSILLGGRTRSIEVRIPAGVTNGSRVRVPTPSRPGQRGSRPSDIFLRISISPHARFTLDGRDLRVDHTVPLTTAVLGGDIDLLTLRGKYLRLKLPEGTQPGQVFRLKGKGMPSLVADGRKGDLFVTIKVSIPKRSTGKVREHYESLAALEVENIQKKPRENS